MAVSTTIFGELAGGDVDGDGDLDLMATDGGTLWLEHPDNGNGWVRHTITSSSQTPIRISVKAVDIDRDGDLDALTSRERTVGIEWHENVAGNGSAWKVRTIKNNLFAGNALVTGAFQADVNSDGWPDAIGTGVLSQGLGPVQIHWFRNIAGTAHADAGPDQAIQCTGAGGAAVTLDGSGSSSNTTLYTWTGPFGTVATPQPTTVVTIPPGTHVLQLQVQNVWNGSDQDSVTITIRPSLTLSPALLWPPNHRIVDVTASLGGCPAAAVLKSITSSELPDAPGEGDGATTQDIQGAALFTADVNFGLRSERAAPGAGRSYTVTYETTGGTGAPAAVQTTVTVPSNMAGGPEPIDLTLSTNGAGTVLSWPAVPGAISYSAIRGSLGGFQILTDEVGVGSVVCLQRGPSTTTAGSEDAVSPQAGQGFFYAVGYDDGLLRSGYGTVQAAWPLTIQSGDCPP